MSDICCDDCGKVLRRSGHKFGEARPAFISGKAARTGKVIERRTRSIRRGSGHGTSERWLGDVVADDGEAEATDRGNLHVDGSSCDSSTTITLRHFGAGERAPSTTSIAAIRAFWSSGRPGAGRRGRGRTGPVRREIESSELGGPRVINTIR